MRAFLAVPVSGAFVDQVRRSLSEVPCLRVTPAENIHLTFVFFEDLKDHQMGDIIGKMKRFRVGHPVRMQLHGPECFPSDGQCRVIVLKDLFLQTSELYASVTKEIVRNPERRRFQPHVTVARTTGKCSMNLQPVTVETEAASLVLFRSDLRPTGPLYSKLYEIQLM